MSAQLQLEFRKACKFFCAVSGNKSSSRNAGDQIDVKTTKIIKVVDRVSLFDVAEYCTTLLHRRVIICKKEIQSLGKMLEYLIVNRPLLLLEQRES